MAQGGTDFAKMMTAVVKIVLGDPNRAHSKPGKPRWGDNGGFEVNESKGVWSDFGTERGGGVIDFLKEYVGVEGKDAIAWLREHGFEVADGRRYDVAPARQVRPDEPPPYEEAPWDTGEPPERDDSDQPVAREKYGEAMKKALRDGPAKVYDYTNPEGDLIWQTCRYEFTANGKREKTFRQRRKPLPTDPKDKIINGWVWSIDGIDPVPYNLIEIRDAIAEGEPIFYVEGEKDVETLREWGCVATCNAMGAGKWTDGLAHWFAGADIIILPDNDPQARTKDGKLRYRPNGAPIFVGQDHAEDVARGLRKVAKRVRVLELTGLPLKGDVTDWRDQCGGSVELLFLEVKKNARDWTPRRPYSRFGGATWTNLDDPGPSVEWVVRNMLTTCDVSVIGGESQSGKSFLATHIGVCVARGEPVLGHKVKQGLVVYQAGESARGVRGRLKATRKHYDIDPNKNLPFVFLSKKVNLFSSDADVEGFIAEIKAWEDYFPDDPLRMIIIDTLAKAAIGAEENSAKEMGIVLSNVEKIRDACNCAVVLVHHMNAQGKKLRGSTAIFANLEQVLAVSVDPETKIRTITMDKMKDGEAGKEYRFELMSVDIGADDDGGRVTSCAVVGFGEKDLARQKEYAEKGIPLRSQNEKSLFGALLAALADHGEAAPAHLGLPVGTMAVKVQQWTDLAVRRDPNPSGTPEAEIAKIRKAMERDGPKLLQFKVIGRDNPWVWWTGRAVRGFAETFPKEPRRKRGTTPASEQPSDNGEPIPGYDDDPVL